MSVKYNYPDQECPDCGDPIPDEAQDGDSCQNCGHVFDNMEIEPIEGDYTTEDHQNFYQYGELVVSVKKDEDWKEKIKQHMEENKFYPSVWFVSDHGNSHLMNLDTKE